jgi:hypothetical protein
MCTKKGEIGTTPYPRRASASAPPMGRKEGGNARQHGTRAATREGARNCAPDQQRTFTSRHGRISNRSPNQKDIAGKNRAHSSTNKLETNEDNELFGDYAILTLSFGLAPSGGIHMQLVQGDPPETQNAT